MRFGLIVFVVLICVGCGCKKQTTTSAEETDDAPNVRISSALPEQTWQTVIRTESIQQFDIEKILIAGTTNEYSNKLQYIGDLDVSERQAVLARLIDDNSYLWTERDTAVDFRPNRQYVLQGEAGRVNVMIDMDNGLLSFINLEGQKVLPIKKSFHEFLMELK